MIGRVSFKPSVEGSLEKSGVLLADDHPGFPEVVERLLKPDFENSWQSYG
jgi:hypothetical protein